MKLTVSYTRSQTETRDERPNQSSVDGLAFPSSLPSRWTTHHSPPSPPTSQASSTTAYAANRRGDVTNHLIFNDSDYLAEVKEGLTSLYPKGANGHDENDILRLVEI